MALATDLALEMAQRVVQLWKWSGFDYQKDFAQAISGDETMMSKWKKGESLTPRHVLQIAYFCAGQQNVVEDPATVLLYLFGLRTEADVWVPSERPVRAVLAPGVGFEPTTSRLTAERSAAELPRTDDPDTQPSVFKPKRVAA